MEGTDRKTFQAWFEKKIFKMQAGKGYKKITLTYNQYKEAFEKDTGFTVSESTMYRAIKELMIEDKIRKEWKCFYVKGCPTPKGKFMQICLGFRSRFFGLLRKLALDAKKKLGKGWQQAENGLSQLFVPHIPSYHDIMCWKWRLFDHPKPEASTVWIEPTPPDPSHLNLSWKKFRDIEK